MRLFAAGGGAYDGPYGALLESALFLCGLTGRLVTYADVTSPSHCSAARFWIGARKKAMEEEMKLYVAGNVKATDADKVDYDTGVRNRLISFAFIDDWADDSFKFWVAARPESASVFLDSGAFSAHQKGAVIDLGRYCDYVKANIDALAAYAVLDVIGDLEATRVNLALMRKAGLDPVPVYHVSRSPLSALEELLAEGTSYVALGGMASDRPRRDVLQVHLDACWRVIQKHWPVKVHALGVMAQWALERYPFYSADGSSAIVGAGMGRVMRLRDGIAISDGWVSDVRRTYDGIVADGIGRTGLKSQSAHGGRRRRNIEAQLALERQVTDLWTLRGVTWA